MKYILIDNKLYKGGIRTFINNLSSLKSISTIDINSLHRLNPTNETMIICHSYIELFRIIARFLFNKCHIVFIFHNMPNNNRLNRIKFLLLSHIFKVFSVIAIFPSRSSRKKYSLFNIKGYLLCHFLDRSSIDSNPPNNSSLTTQEKKIRFLFSGRVCTERFFPQLLDIFNNIIEKEKRYSVELLVAGGSDIENINSIIKSPKIFMLGLLEREQLDKLEYDCLISLMSLDREEAFGYSIGEAAVRNKYIICNSGAGIVHHISYNRMVLIDNVNYKSVEESINSALKLIQENIPPTLVFSNQEMLTGEHWLDSLNKIVLFHTSSTFRT